MFKLVNIVWKAGGEAFFSPLIPFRLPGDAIVEHTYMHMRAMMLLDERVKEGWVRTSLASDVDMSW